MKLVAGCGPKPVPEGWVGIDIEPEYVKRARECSPNATVMLGDILALPMEDNSVDEVVCWEVFEHIEQQDGVIDELARVCKPGATLLLSTPLMHVEKFLSAISRNYRESVLIPHHQNCLHPRETLRKVRRKFDVEKVWYAPEAFAFCFTAALVMDRQGVTFNGAGEFVGANAEKVHQLAQRMTARTTWFWKGVNTVIPYWATKSICISARCRKESQIASQGAIPAPHSGSRNQVRIS